MSQALQIQDSIQPVSFKLYDADFAGFSQKPDTAVGNEAHAAGCPQFAGIDRGDGEAIPALAHFRPRQAEHLDGDAELEGAEPVIGKRHDERILKRWGSGKRLWHDLEHIWQ